MAGVVLDIETRIHPDIGKRLGIAERIAAIRGEEDPAELRRLAAMEDVAVANLKDPVKIAAKIEQALQAKVTKAALNCYGAQITTIAWAPTAGARDHLTDWREHQRQWQVGRVIDIEVEEITEAELIATFLGSLMWEFDENLTLVGFNIRGNGSWSTGFDIKMLRVRAAMLGVDWPHSLPGSVREDRNSRRLFDLCEVFPEGTAQDILLACDLPPKSAKGNDVANMTPQERLAYCAHDCQSERLLFAQIADLSAQTASLID